MRIRLVTCLAVLFLLIPATAFADSHDVDVDSICYEDPTAPECVTVVQPRLFDAGAGGTAPAGTSPALALGVGLALTAGLTARRSALRGR